MTREGHRVPVCHGETTSSANLEQEREGPAKVAGMQGPELSHTMSSNHTSGT